MSVTEQRYQAVLAVLSEGRTISEVGLQWGVDRRTVHCWPHREPGASTGRERLLQDSQV